MLKNSWLKNQILPFCIFCNRAVNSIISKNLNELETWLDKKLIFRSTRNIRLTQDGLNCLEECRVILNNSNYYNARNKTGVLIKISYYAKGVIRQTGGHVDKISW